MTFDLPDVNVWLALEVKTHMHSRECGHLVSTAW